MRRRSRKTSNEKGPRRDSSKKGEKNADVGKIQDASPDEHVPSAIVRKSLSQNSDSDKKAVDAPSLARLGATEMHPLHSRSTTEYLKHYNHWKNSIDEYENISEMDDDVDEIGERNSSIEANENDSLVRSEMYASIVAAFEKNRNKDKDVSAALIVVLNKSNKEDEETNEEEISFFYHNVELAEKITPQRPSTPLWKTYRWKKWAIKKGIIPDPDNIPIADPEVENIPPTQDIDKPNSSPSHNREGSPKDLTITPEYPGEDGLLDNYIDISEEMHETITSNESDQPKYHIDHNRQTNGIEGANEDEGRDSNEVNYFLPNFEEEDEEDDDEEEDGSEEGENSEEEESEETEEKKVIVECVSSEMYEVIKKSFEASMGSDVSAALIIAMKPPGKKDIDNPEEDLAYLCHPVELSEVIPQRPSTPLWKTYRWKAWALKKGIIQPEAEAISSLEEDNKESASELIVDLGEDEESILNETLFKDGSLKEVDEEDILITKESESILPMSTENETEFDNETAIIDSEAAETADLYEDNEMVRAENEQEEELEENALRSAESLVEVRKKRNRLSIEIERKAAEEDRLKFTNIIEKLKTMDITAYCERRNLRLEKKQNRENGIDGTYSSTDSDYTNCSTSSGNNINVASEAIQSSESPILSPGSVGSANALKTIFENTSDSPNNEENMKAVENEEDEELQYLQKMEDQIETAVTKLLEELESPVRKTSAEVEDDNNRSRKNSYRKGSSQTEAIEQQRKSQIDKKKSIKSEGEIGNKVLSITEPAPENPDSKENIMSDEIRKLSLNSGHKNSLPPVDEPSNNDAENPKRQSSSPKLINSGDISPIVEKAKSKSKEISPPIEIRKKSLPKKELEEQGNEKEEISGATEKANLFIEEEVPKNNSLIISTEDKSLGNDANLVNDVENKIECIDETVSSDFHFSLTDFTKKIGQQRLAQCKIPLERDFKEKTSYPRALSANAGVHSVPERLKKHRTPSSDSQIAINNSSGLLCDYVGNVKDKDSPTRFSNFGSPHISRGKLLGKSASDIIRRSFPKEAFNKPKILDGASITAIVKGNSNAITCPPYLSSSSIDCSVQSAELNESPEVQDDVEVYEEGGSLNDSNEDIDITPDNTDEHKNIVEDRCDLHIKVADNPVNLPTLAEQVANILKEDEDHEE